MNFNKLNKILFPETFTIKDVLEKFNKTSLFTRKKGFGLVVSLKGKLVGVVTEGDVRRKILSGLLLDDLVTEVMNSNYAYVTEKDTTYQILKLFDQRIENIPLVDKNHIPIDLYQKTDFSVSNYRSSTIIRATVPVRVSFTGGGTDFTKFINNKPCFILSSTINKFCTASILLNQNKGIKIYSRDLDEEIYLSSIKNIKYDGQLDLLKAAIKMMQPQFSFYLETFSECEKGTGLGGSSAMTIAVLGALNYLRDHNKLNLYNLSDLAFQSERIDLDIKGGWQDQYACAFGGFNWIEFNKNEVLVNPLKIQREYILELEHNLMLFRIGGTHDSNEIQEAFNIEYTNKHNDQTIEIMSDLANQMKNNLLKGNLNRFGSLLHQAWKIKKDLNPKVANPLIDKCYSLAIDNGALGGKLLGAGQSGYLLIYSIPQNQNRIRKALEASGCKIETFKFHSKGLEVWSTENKI